MKKAIMTDMRVNKSTNTVDMYIRGMGRVHHIKKDHRFPSRPLSETQVKEIQKEIKNNPKLSPHILIRGCDEIETKGKNAGKPVFNILHYKAPIEVSSELQKKLKNKFITGNYAEEERLRKGTPHSKFSIDEKIAQIITSTNTYNKEVSELKNELLEHLIQENENITQSSQTRIFNLLNRPYLKKGGISDEEKEKLLKKIPQKFIDKRKKIEKHRTVVDKEATAKTFIRKTYETLEVIVEDEKIQFEKSLSDEEIYNEIMCLLDIEVPHYKKKGQVSWVGITYFQNNTIIKKEMHTLSPVGLETLKGYTIIQHEKESDLIKKVAESIRIQNPLVIGAFNNRFDWLTLREAGEFLIGEEEKRPVLEVSTQFFERVGVYSHLTLDLLRAAQIIYHYLPNKKLELVSKMMLGKEGLTKSINYDEMAGLESIALGMHTRKDITDMGQLIEKHTQKTIAELSAKQLQQGAAQVIANYLVGDVDVMPKMVQSKRVREFIDTTSRIAAATTVPLQWAMYSPRSIQLLLKRDFFNRYGTHKENLFWNKKEQREKISKAKQDFRTLLTNKGNIISEPGVYKNVHLSYMKYGHLLKDTISKLYPSTQKFFNIEATSPYSKYILSQFGNSLAEWLIVDYTNIKIQQHELNKKIDRNKTNYTTIEDMWWDLEGRMKVQASKSNLGKLYGGNLDLKTFKKYASQTINDIIYSDSKQVESDQLSLFELDEHTDTQKKKNLKEIEKTTGRYLSMINLFKKQNGAAYRFEKEYGVKEHVIDKEFGLMLAGAKKFAKDNNLEIIHQEGPYMYFIGDISNISNDIFINTFDEVFISHEHKPTIEDKRGKQKLYYELHGIYHGTKIVNHPIHFLTVHEMQMQKGFFDNIFENKVEESIDAIVHSVREIHTQKVPNEKLVEFSKSEKRYSAYENGEKIYFHTETPLDKEGKKIELEIDETNYRRGYFTEINKKEQFVPIMDVNEFEPDWNMYYNRVKKKSYDLLYSLIGKGTDALFSEFE